MDEMTKSGLSIPGGVHVPEEHKANKPTKEIIECERCHSLRFRAPTAHVLSRGACPTCVALDYICARLKCVHKVKVFLDECKQCNKEGVVKVKPKTFYMFQVEMPILKKPEAAPEAEATENDEDEDGGSPEPAAIEA